MTPLDLARLFYEKANEDYEALKKLAPHTEIADASVGFHAQRAAEKYIKSILAIELAKPLRTHDLDALLDEVRALGRAVPEDLPSMTEWTPYAVRDRYPFAEPHRTLDRDSALAAVGRLKSWVEKILRVAERESDSDQ